MDIKQIRSKNYHFLFGRFKASIWAEFPEEPERGMLKRFAEKLDLSEAYISHINTGYKQIGDKTARKFELALKLPNGWMDKEHHEGAPRTPEEDAFVAAAVKLYRESPNEAQAMLLKAFSDKLHAAGTK